MGVAVNPIKWHIVWRQHDLDGHAIPRSSSVFVVDTLAYWQGIANPNDSVTGDQGEPVACRFATSLIDHLNG